MARLSRPDRPSSDYVGFDELSVVTLRSLVTTDVSELQPGSMGTVVHRHGAADAYEVEFADPLPVVVTLRGSDLSLAA